APGVPERVTKAVHRALAKQADERFATVGAYVEALTGQALTVTRPQSIPPPEVGFATGSRGPPTDAFARPLGSGAHSAPALPNAPTVDSQGDKLALGATRKDVDHKRRSPALIIACVIVGAAIAAVVMFIVMREPDNEQVAPAPPVVAAA